MMTFFCDKKKATALVLFVIISSIGFYIRYDNINHWLGHEGLYFSPIDNNPATLTPDAYYYMDIAKDYLKGNIEKQDQQRQAPNYFNKHIPLPLLSITLALTSKVTNMSLEWVAILLPPFLAVLLAIPVYFLAALLFRLSGFTAAQTLSAGMIMACSTATLFTLLSPAFVQRSSIGLCDTDILNVTFLCSLTFLALRAATSNSMRELTFSLTAFTLITGLFMLWWDMAIQPVIAFSLGYFLLAAVFGIARNRSNIKVYAFFLLCLWFLFIGLHGSALMIMLPNDLIQTFKYSISMDSSGTLFPYAGKLVAEQRDVSWAELAVNIAGTEWVFYLSLLGTALLAIMTRQYFLFLMPWLIILLLTTRSLRLMIFASVIFGLGLGTVVFLVCAYLKKFDVFRILSICIVISMIATFPYTKSQLYFSASTYNELVLYDCFKRLSAKIPDGSIVWSSWGNGHPLVFYTKAKTIGDGIFHPPELIYSQYVPFATSNFRLAANWISFYSTHGLTGLKETNKLLAGSSNDWAKGIPALKDLLGKGIEESRDLLRQQYNFSDRDTEQLLSFMFPAPSSPVYLLLDFFIFREKWYEWGGMTFTDSDNNNSSPLMPIPSFAQSGNTLQGHTYLEDISFDLLTGEGTIGSTQVKLKQLIKNNGGKPFIQNFKAPAGAQGLLLNQKYNISYGALVDEKMLNTVFIKLFFLQEYDKTFFQPIMNESPLLMAYQVKGDVYTADPKSKATPLR